MKLSKTLTAIFFLISIFSFTTVSAQEDREDVVYLKNGNIYHGTIILQVPGDYLKIETGKDVLTVDFKDIEKIAKESKLHPNARTQERYDDTEKDRYYRHSEDVDDRRRDRRRTPREFVYRKKGYFFQGQVIVGVLEAGIRIINGYKFGQFGFLGLGVGVDGVILDVNSKSTDFVGPHFPVFLHYEGDVLKKRITPFYQIEAGYSFRPSKGGDPIFGSNSDMRTYGGPMGGFGFGARFYKGNRASISISLNVDIKYPTTTFANTYYGGGGYAGYSTSEVMIFPAFKLGIGF